VILRELARMSRRQYMNVETYKAFTSGDELTLNEGLTTFNECLGSSCHVSVSGHSPLLF
jgi:hypothetical protein